MSTTWGITDDAFAPIIFVATLLAFLASGVIRWRFTNRSLAAGWQPDAVDLAFAAGGGGRALLAALVALRVADALSIGDGKRLSVTGPLPDDAGPLTAAVHRAAERGVAADRLTADRDVGPALAETRKRLVRHGWVPPIRRRWIVVATGLPLLAVACLGILRIVSGAREPLLVTMTVVTVIGAAATMATVRPYSRDVGGELAARRGRNRHLAPWARPSSTTYGAAGGALSVALFGTAAVWATAESVAVGMGLRQPIGDGSGWSSGCGGAAGGCGSSCGGGCGS